MLTDEQLVAKGKLLDEATRLLNDAIQFKKDVEAIEGADDVPSLDDYDLSINDIEECVDDFPGDEGSGIEEEEEEEGGGGGEDLPY